LLIRLLCGLWPHADPKNAEVAQAVYRAGAGGKCEKALQYEP
jgi:hypothetical protein